MDDNPLDIPPEEGVASGCLEGVDGEFLDDMWEIRRGAPSVGPSRAALCRSRDVV